MKKIYLILISILYCQESNAQHEGFKIPDSLSDKDYSYLKKGVTRYKTENFTTAIYAKSWLSKSRSEQNWKQMAMAYRTIMYRKNKKGLLPYSDSLLVAAKKSKDNGLIGTAYLTKGIIHYDHKELSKALNNYLIADEYISKTNDEYAIHKIKYSIAHTKYYLGFYDEALALFKECTDYFENENDRAYLNSLHSLGLCYNKISNYDLCTFYNTLGLEQSKKLGNSDMVPYFNHSEAINQYFKKNYAQSITILKKILPEIKDKKDFANETVAYFYIGKSYWALKKQSTAIPFLLKVDKAYIKQKYSRPDLRENYELLINYYKKHNNPALQLVYTNRLLEVDEMLNQNYKNLSQKIFKEYDTKKLFLSKEELEKSMKSKSRRYYILLISLSATLFFMTFKHLKNKRHYKQKFEDLMSLNAKEEKSIPINNNSNNIELDINPEVTTMILKNLEKFEKNKKYLEKEMNLLKIANQLNTNTKYASKIIYKYRSKKTIEYINDLKIDHIIGLLKNENKYRYYTNKALGEEAGFGSTQNFTRAFKNRTEISPTYFIQEIKKSL